jgi:hypothetical protein
MPASNVVVTLEVTGAIALEYLDRVLRPVLFASRKQLSGFGIYFT